MRKLLGAVLAVLVLWVNGARAEFDVALESPESFGDQVIFYYDARPDFTTFIALRNGAEVNRTVQILFYGQAFGTPFSRIITIPARQLVILDVGGLRGDGLPAGAGVAIATTVDGSLRPIATAALAGNFTVANLLTGSAFGASGAARSALDDEGIPLIDETVIGPETGVLQAIRPNTALLAAYYDPATLAPAANGGNQLVFVNFVDNYGESYTAASAFTRWNVFASASNGTAFPDGILTTEGVVVTTLQSILGPGANGSAGGITFVADDATIGVNRLVYFAEALGTFGTGYLLPPLKLRLNPN